MKRLENFKELKKTMINPLDNPEFYALLLGDDRYKWEAFSLCHNYELGSTTAKNYYNLLCIAIQQYLQNLDYQKYIKRHPNDAQQSYQTMLKVLSNVLKSEDNLENFINKNAETAERVFGIGEHTVEDRGKTYINSVGWFYFKSHHLNPNLSNNHIRSDKVKHRLYLTVDTNERAEIANKIIEKCNQKGIPYNFKVHINFKKRKENQQSDTIVIYLADEEQVVEYVNFINEIIEENKELRKHIHKPSPHLGIVNDYIGYGFEPRLNQGRTSYSKLLKESVSSISTLKLAINILQILATPGLRRRYGCHIPEGFKYYHKPNDLKEMQLAPIEKYQELIALLRKSKKTPQEYEELRKCFSGYFKRENMDLDVIKELRQQISKNLVKKYPQLSENNMFDIDVDVDVDDVRNQYI